MLLPEWDGDGVVEGDRDASLDWVVKIEALLKILAVTETETVIDPDPEIVAQWVGDVDNVPLSVGNRDEEIVLDCTTVVVAEIVNAWHTVGEYELDRDIRLLDVVDTVGEIERTPVAVPFIRDVALWRFDELDVIVELLDADMHAVVDGDRVAVTETYGDFEPAALREGEFVKEPDAVIETELLVDSEFKADIVIWFVGLNDTDAEVVPLVLTDGDETELFDWMTVTDDVILEEVVNETTGEIVGDDDVVNDTAGDNVVIFNVLDMIGVEEIETVTVPE